MLNNTTERLQNLKLSSLAVFKTLCKTGSSFLFYLQIPFFKSHCFDMDCFLYYHDSITRSNYCHLEVDFRVTLLKKLFKGVQCELIKPKVTSEKKVVKYFSSFKCNVLFIDLSKFELMKLKTSCWSKNCYLPELNLNYISFKANSKSQMNIWEAANIIIWKIINNRSVLIF